MLRVVVLAASLALVAAPGCKKEELKQEAKKEDPAAKAKAEAEAKAKAAADAAVKAEAEAKAKAEAEAKAAEEAKVKAEEEAKAKAEAEAKAAEEAKVKAEEEAKAKAEAEAKAVQEAQAKGTELVDKAIAAAGGLEALTAKYAAYTVKSKGTYMGMPYEMTTWWKAPDGLVMDVTSMAMVMGYVGTDCWSKLADLVVDCPEMEKKTVPMMQYTTWVFTLYPLKGEGFVATYKGDAEYDGVKVSLVEVTREGAPGPVTFAFDQATGLVARLDYAGSWGGQEGLLSSRVVTWQDLDGIKAPAKTAMFFGDKLMMEDEFVSGTLGTVDEAALARPAQAAAGTTRIKPVMEHPVVFALHKGGYDGIGATIGKVYACIGMNQLMPMGGPVMAFLKDPSQTQNPEEYETEVLVEVGQTALETLQGEGCSIKKIPAGEVAARVEFGPYDKVAANYGELAKWVADNGYAVSGPSLMATYNDPTTTAPEALISELMFMVVKK